MMNSNFWVRSITVLSLWVALSLAAFSDDSAGKTGNSEVTIDAPTAQNLGIKVAPVQRQKLPVEMVVTGQIELLPSQKVEITSPIKGQGLQLLVQPGAKVKAGQAVATITPVKKNEVVASLSQAQTELQLAQESYRRIYQIAKADREQALSQLAAAQSRLNQEQQLLRGGDSLQVARTNYQRQRQISQAEIDVARYAVNLAQENYQRDLGAVAAGYGTRQKVVESRSRIAETQAVLAKALNQPGLIQAETELRKAETNLPLRRLQEAEKQVVAAKGQLAQTVNQKSLIAANDQLRKAKVAVVAAQNRQALSADPDGSLIGQSDNQNGVITVKSSIDGIVADRDTPGQSVLAAGTKIVTITADRQVLATANIDEKDLAKVKIGQEATIKVGSEVFNGSVSRIGAATSGQSQATPVQVAISNSGDSLKSGMSVELKLVTEESTTLTIAVPSTSVVEVEGKKIVYVQNNTTYQATNVELGQTIGDLVEVKSGLFAGDQVVVQQAMQIYTQSLKTPAHDQKKDTAKTLATGGWQTLSLWWLAIPGTLVTGSGAWWLMKKRQNDNDYIDVEEALQVEMIMENSNRSNIYDFDAEERIQTDIQTEVIDVEEIY